MGGRTETCRFHIGMIVLFQLHYSRAVTHFSLSASAHCKARFILRRARALSHNCAQSENPPHSGKSRLPPETDILPD